MEMLFVLLLLMGILIAAAFLGNRSGGGRAGARLEPRTRQDDAR